MKFMYSFLEHLIIIMYGLIQKTIEAKEGKFVNMEEVYRLSAIELRRFSEQNNQNDEDEITDLITGTIGMLNRIADSYDKIADLLEEKRKTIEFARPLDKKVFIIHGHNDGLLSELKDILVSFKVEPIILKNEADKGKTVIEKLEDYGKLCGFAFALVTPDDIVENKKKKIFQARPNVLYELGWFCGRYGRSRVRILKQEGTSLPSDLDGLVTIDFSNKVEEVYRKIEKDLKETGILN